MTSINLIWCLQISLVSQPCVISQYNVFWTFGILKHHICLNFCSFFLPHNLLYISCLYYLSSPSSVLSFCADSLQFCFCSKLILRKRKKKKKAFVSIRTRWILKSIFYRYSVLQRSFICLYLCLFLTWISPKYPWPLPSQAHLQAHIPPWPHQSPPQVLGKCLVPCAGVSQCPLLPHWLSPWPTGRPDTFPSGADSPPKVTSGNLPLLFLLQSLCWLFPLYIYPVHEGEEVNNLFPIAREICTYRKEIVSILRLQECWFWRKLFFHGLCKQQ